MDYDLPKEHTESQKNDNDNNSENSVISMVLDIFNFKKCIKLICVNQKYFKITDNFINLILLETFLVGIFVQTNTLKFEWDSVTQALSLILFVSIIELAGANEMFAFLDNDTSCRKFIKELSSMPHQKIKLRSYRIDFSEKCLNDFICSVVCHEKCDLDTVYNVIDSQFLRRSNLDSLFDPKTLNSLHPNIIIRVLFKYQDSLTKTNMLNIYNKYKDSKIKENEIIFKVLFATQRYSDVLIQEYPNDKILSDYYTIFQNQKPLYLRPISILVSPLKYARKANWFLVILIVIKYWNDLKTLDVLGLIIVIGFLWMIVDIISTEMILPFVLRISKWYYRYLVHRVYKISSEELGPESNTFSDN